MDLTTIQKDILTALINLQRQKECSVKGEEIAELIHRNPGTIRNQMQLLKALGLVEGVPGPKGGYRPTGDAYQALDIEVMDEETIVPVFRNGIAINNATTAEISFTTVRNPEKCRGVVKVIGNIKDFVSGDIIQIGPTPVNRLTVRGEVFGRDDSNNLILVNITEMISLPKKHVKYYMKPLTLAVNSNVDLQEIARHFIAKNLHGAAVEDHGKVVGVITTTDVTKAVAMNKFDVRAKDMMAKELITVDGEMQLYDVVRLFYKYNIGQLVVTIDGVPKGILSKTDVMNELAVY
ncbi:MAG: CBS domain-containing protein [Methanimicrococcus sp.]|nr:CBS domain-containing protein [Methanimicrococcus sp.]